MAKGLFASGYCDGPIVLERSWNPDAASPMTTYVPIRFDVLLEPGEDGILARAELDEAPFDQFHWNTQGSGIAIPTDIAAALEIRWRQFMDGLTCPNKGGRL